ncbi:hypothetical protein DET0322 [Dehalococcoides mccartyi 195]|uniref:Uncharacterized protein n=1 Tax=Dehalococcoides mccartyi (strain ATCC BAA-2266 / KCTC 15142 / 195) TaxID=243164 RepID=Q3Z9M9_DEHM1|nr:hypothetical protein DET0322 [Dehalococcoides mccartyi 195]
MDKNTEKFPDYDFWDFTQLIRSSFMNTRLFPSLYEGRPFLIRL